MADTADFLIRVVYNEDSEEKRFSHPISDLAVNEADSRKIVMATNSTVTLDIGTMGTVGATDNTGTRIIGIQAGATDIVYVRVNTAATTGQHPIAPGGAYLAYTSGVTGLRIANPSTTNTATIRFVILDT